MMQPKNWLVFNGRASNDFGVYISGNGTFSSAERDYERIEVPGRSGDLFIDNGRFRNIEVTYPAWIAEDMYDNLQDLKNHFMKSRGYCVLRDTYHPNEYRLALYKGPLDVAAVISNLDNYDFAQFALEFDCKPQRYLDSGDIKQTFTANGNLVSPDIMPSKPLINVYGHGQFKIGNYQIEIATHSLPYITIDTELLDCYYGTTNANMYVTFQNGVPIIETGTTSIKFVSSTITKIEIIPRWWIL